MVTQSRLVAVGVEIVEQTQEALKRIYRTYEWIDVAVEREEPKLSPEFLGSGSRVVGGAFCWDRNSSRRKALGHRQDRS